MEISMQFNFCGPGNYAIQFFAIQAALKMYARLASWFYAVQFLVYAALQFWMLVA